MIKIAKNNLKNDNLPCGYSFEETGNVRRIHEMSPAYNETKLVKCDKLAEKFGVKEFLVKDESSRFNLKAFKALGGFYAIFTTVCELLDLDETKVTLDELLSEPLHSKIKELTFITTTDGNHGKGISWTAGILGCPSYVFMPKGTVEVRAQAIRDAGTAKVEITDMNYDQCVAYTSKLAEEKGWVFVQDTSWEGYEKIPERIMKGYTTLLYEALSQMMDYGLERPTHVFLQAGVGAMAGAVSAGLAESFPENRPLISIVEPHAAACVFESIEEGKGNALEAKGDGVTIMAGLNCGTPCSIAWDILKDVVSFAFSCDDETTEIGMRALATEGIVAGESGAVAAGLMASLSDEMRKELGIDENSVVLMINTEGDTDPEDYKRVVGTKL